MYDYEFGIVHEWAHRERLLAAAKRYRLLKAARAAKSGQSSRGH